MVDDFPEGKSQLDTIKYLWLERGCYYEPVPVDPTQTIQEESLMFRRWSELYFCAFCGAFDVKSKCSIHWIRRIEKKDMMETGEEVICLLVRK